MAAAADNAGIGSAPNGVGDLLRARAGMRPRVHLVLGSGLGGLAERVRNPVRIPFADLPGLPQTTVPGHTGAFLAGWLGGVPVLVQSGRFHYYEGRGAATVLAPIRAGRAAGARIVVLTNAAGGIRSDLTPGSLMLLDDHISALFRAPLAGLVQRGEERFPDMSRPYDEPLAKLAEAVALDAGIPLSRGVYAAVHGPAFETPAEVRALRAAGADAVGMSTVPEATAARAAGQRLIAFSLITNRAAGLGLEALDHAEVLHYGKTAGALLGTLLEALLTRLPPQRTLPSTATK